MHLGGRHEFSTFRLSLGSILAVARDTADIDEEHLTEWMHAHLSLIALPIGARVAVDPGWDRQPVLLSGRARSREASSAADQTAPHQRVDRHLPHYAEVDHEGAARTVAAAARALDARRMASPYG